MSNIDEIQIPFRHKNLTATILSGQTESDVIDSRGASLIGIIIPAAFTGTSLTFEVGSGPDGSTLADYYNAAGTQISVAVAPSRYVGMAAIDFAPTRFLKIISDQSEGADRAVILVFRGLS